MRRSLCWVLLFLLIALGPLHCPRTAFVIATPSTQLGVDILNANGVALSANGSTAFVTTDLPNPLVYVVPLPITSSSNLNPSPYWTSPRSSLFYYIAASVSTSPQVLYLLDNQNAQLVSLAILHSPPVNSTLIYDFGIANLDLIDGMYFQVSTHLLFFSCYCNFSGVTLDFIAWLDPTSSSPSLQTLYVTSFMASIAGLAVSSTHLYFGTFTYPLSAVNYTVAEIWAVPLTGPYSTSLIPNTTQPQLLYTTLDSNLNTLDIGDLVYPAAFVLNANESILYMTDIGNQDAQQGSTPHGVFALYPLYSPIAPLNFTTIFGYEGQNTEVQASFALSPDQSTLYFAAVGHKNGLYIISKANSSIPLSAPPLSISSSSAGAAATTSPPSSTSTSASASTSIVSQLSSSALPASTATSTGVVSSSASNAVPLLPVGTVSLVTSFAAGAQPMTCFTANDLITAGFFATVAGLIFNRSMTAQPQMVVTPLYTVGNGLTDAGVIACQAHPTEPVLYLLDMFNVALYRFNATDGKGLVVISTFPQEQVGTLTSLAIDFTSSIAYVGTQGTQFIYAVNLSITRQSSSSFGASPINSDVTALALSQDEVTLFYGSPGFPNGTINALQIQAGSLLNPSNPTVLYSSNSLIYPNALLVSDSPSSAISMMYMKDGGPTYGGLYFS